MKNILIALVLFLSASTNAVEIGSEDDEDEDFRINVSPYKSQNFRYAGENEVVRMFINDKIVYYVKSNNFFEKIRVAPVRLDLKTDTEFNKEGTTYINYMYFNCITKQNMIVLLHVFDVNGNLIDEVRATDFTWKSTTEGSNYRNLNEYICNLP